MLIFAAIICRFLSVLATEHEQHWIFIHYHKTGHDLARKLAGVFRSNQCDIVTRFKFPRRISILNHTQAIAETDIAVLAAPDVHVAWNERFLLQTEATVAKFVHFLRDPGDMVLSAYLYHAQERLPELERWLRLPSFDPCEFDQRLLFDQYGVTIGTYFGNSSHVADLITNTIKLCKTIMRAHRHKQALGYNQLLRSMSAADGVLLEAARSILSASGGDILRMATNALHEMHTENASSHRVFLSDFPIGDADAFMRASQRLYEFLMCPTGRVGAPFWSCMTVDQAVLLSMEAAFVPSHVSGNSITGGSHVTQGMLSKGEREALLLHLSLHPSIGPLLNIVRDIIHQNVSVSVC
jgi:hypothetical protein